MIANYKKHDKVPLAAKFLYALVFTLVFEGIARKVITGPLNLFIFFIKDIICVFGIYHIFNFRFSNQGKRLQDVYKIVLFLFIPVLIVTSFYDLTLSLFGLKQYLLYPVVGLLFPMAFQPGNQKSFIAFTNCFALLIIPTTFVSILQNSLPASHWLNLSVTGESLEGFAAAGFLRVSSTFSFTGQYSFFLNGVCSYFAIRFIFQPNFHNKFYRIINPYIPVFLGLLLIVSTFITGGRTAVLGCGSCLVIGSIMTSLRSPKIIVQKGFVIAIIVLISLFFVKQIKPEFFAAYEKRSMGYQNNTQSEEIQQRVSESLLGWTDWAFKQDILSLAFGNGIGVMSNGSDKVSSYAGKIRSSGFWTEADMPTTVWEGGIYLFIIWYGFRLWIIHFCYQMWRKTKNEKYATAISFLFAHVLVIGLIGQIAMQPPIAIWWWLSIGGIVTIKNFDYYEVSANKRKNSLLKQVL